MHDVVIDRGYIRVLRWTRDGVVVCHAPTSRGAYLETSAKSTENG